MRSSQEKVVHALQEYTVAHYPDMASKFGELLLRMPELQRVCQVHTTQQALWLSFMHLMCPLSGWEGDAVPLPAAQGGGRRGSWL